MAGLTGKAQGVVTKEQTAKQMGSGSLEVFATPCLVALMESAACNAIEQVLEAGSTSVGVEIHITHSAATPVGMRVWAEATLTHREGRTYRFTIQAYDQAGPIGSAEHTRVAVQAAKFQEKTDAKHKNLD